MAQRLAKNEQKLCEELEIGDRCWEWASVRVDYTKGILERFRRNRAFIEENRQYFRAIHICADREPFTRPDITRVSQFLA